MEGQQGYEKHLWTPTTKKTCYGESVVIIWILPFKACLLHISGTQSVDRRPGRRLTKTSKCHKINWNICCHRRRLNCHQSTRHHRRLRRRLQLLSQGAAVTEWRGLMLNSWRQDHRPCPSLPPSRHSTHTVSLLTILCVSVFDSLLCKLIRAVATGVYRYTYPPKIRPSKFLWSKNDVLMVIDLILHY